MDGGMDSSKLWSRFLLPQLWVEALFPTVNGHRVSFLKD